MRREETRGDARRREETRGDARRREETRGDARRREETRGDARRRDETRREETRGDARSYFIRVLVGVMIFFQAQSKGHHQKIMVTSYICSWKAPCTIDVYTGAETFLDHDVINLIVCFPIGTMPCPPSGWFVGAESVR